MQAVKAISDFLTGLGSPVMLPIIIFVLSLILGQTVRRAFTSALTIGVGFIGLNLVIGLLLGALSPATDLLVKSTGLNLTALDVGWGVCAAIAFGTTVGAIILPLTFGVNILMILLKATKTLNVDMWNFWHYAFTGSLVYLVTKSIWLGLLAAVIHAVVSLLIADWTASVFKVSLVYLGFLSHRDGQLQVFQSL